VLALPARKQQIDIGVTGMRKVFETAGHGLFGWLAARPAEQPATLPLSGVRPRDETSITAADRDRRGECLDAVAGSEFVDDRIRLRE